MSLLVAKEETMIGSYPPQKAAHEVTFPRIGWEECPSGTLQRGDYKAKSKVIFHIYFGVLCNQIDWIVRFKPVVLIRFCLSSLTTTVKTILSTITPSRLRRIGPNKCVDTFSTQCKLFYQRCGLVLHVQFVIIK